jgi:[ribosomal protein S18]-alanine N-acetyltransferase
MTVKEDFRIRSAVYTDQRQLARLIQYSPHVHRHLDWRSPLDWVGSVPFVVAESGGEPVAAFACPPDPPGVAWLRLFADSERVPLAEAWHVLWEAARAELAGKGAVVAAIVLQEWLQVLLVESGFSNRQNIVMLERDLPSTGPVVPPEGVSLRTMLPYDLPVVAEVDAAAFDPVWQNSLPALNRAFPQAMLATVAETAGGVIGYQISTRNPFGCHLARLAVRPGSQKHGVGQALVVDLVDQLAQRGISRITVNTQSDNRTSLALYKRLGFEETGEQYPVYEYPVA